MLIDTLADYLTAGGLATVATDLFVGYLPAAPDDCAALFATGGSPPDAAQGYDWPTFQARARGADPRAAYDRMAVLFAALHGLHAITLPDGSYLVDCLALQSSPVAIGQDAADRYEYTLNFRARVRNLTPHRS